MFACRRSVQHSSLVYALHTTSRDKCQGPNGPLRTGCLLWMRRPSSPRGATTLVRAVESLELWMMPSSYPDRTPDFALIGYQTARVIYRDRKVAVYAVTSRYDG